MSREGLPDRIAVHHAATETAFERMPTLCRGIGSARMGVIASRFLEQTTMDLFTEQAGYPYPMRRYCEVLVPDGD